MFDDQLVGLFIDAELYPGAAAEGCAFIRCATIFYLFLGIEEVVLGALRGAGDVGFQMFAIVANMGLRVVAAIVLANLFHQASLIWWAIPISFFLHFMLGVLRYRSGKWKNKSLTQGHAQAVKE